MYTHIKNMYIYIYMRIHIYIYVYMYMIFDLRTKVCKQDLLWAYLEARTSEEPGDLDP